MAGKRRMGRDPVPAPTPPAGGAPPVALAPPLAAPPPAVPEVIRPLPTRREERMQRRKDKRRKIGFAGGSAIAIGAVVVIAAVAFGVHKVTESTAPPPRTQTTVLFQLQGPAGGAAASALLAHDPANQQGVQVLIPARVLSEVCGYGEQNFGQMLALPNGIAASEAATSSLLGGITVDGAWVLNEAQFVRLIGALGGHITVGTVDVNVVRPRPGGGSIIEVPHGNNVPLNGTQAYEYATYVASSDEPAAAELARLQQVINGVLAALPKTSTGIAAVLRQTEGNASSTLGSDKLATFLAGLSTDYAHSGDLYATDLPTATVDAGGAPSYRVDGESAGLKSLVSQHLAGSVPAGAGSVRPTVLLLNGVGTYGLVPTACSRLSANGLAYAGSGNAPTFSKARSTVAVRSDGQVALGDRVAKALGLGAGDVVIDRSPETVADVVVTLGSDYKP